MSGHGLCLAFSLPVLSCLVVLSSCLASFVPLVSCFSHLSFFVLSCLLSSLILPSLVLGWLLLSCLAFTCYLLFPLLSCLVLLLSCLVSFCLCLSSFTFAFCCRLVCLRCPLFLSSFLCLPSFFFVPFFLMSFVFFFFVRHPLSSCLVLPFALVLSVICRPVSLSSRCFALSCFHYYFCSLCRCLLGLLVPYFVLHNRTAFVIEAR
jgi:hypothetical protein